MLRRKHLSPPLYQEVADRVMELYDEGLLLGKIADRLKLDRNTVTAAVRWWHESRGLPAPDGRTRRKQLTNKTANKAKPKAKPKAASAAPTSQDGPRATSA